MKRTSFTGPGTGQTASRLPTEIVPKSATADDFVIVADGRKWLQIKRLVSPAARVLLP